MTTIKVTREDLYDLVWRTPMSRLAAEFGVSDVALAKTCQRLAVPRPGRGYWAKLAAGIRTKRPPLAKGSGVEGWTFFERLESPVERPRKQQAPMVPTPKDLRSAADAVKRLGLALGAADKDRYGRLLVPGAHGPLLAVSIAAHRRALLLLAGFGAALERRGHSLDLRDDGGANALSIVLGDDTIGIALVERLEQKEHVLTADELRRAGTGRRFGIPKYDHFAGGRLQLVVHSVRGNRTSWSDTKTRTLERQLGAVILAAEGEALRRQHQRLLEEERRREDALRRAAEEEERRQRALREARAQHSRRLETDLRQMARAWSDAEEIRRFVRAVRGAIPIGSQDDRTAAWLEWADAVVRTLDPLAKPNEVPKTVRPTDEELAQVR